MEVSLTALAYVSGLLGVGVISLVLGLRLGGQARTTPPVSEEAQVAAAFGVLKRHFEKRALAEMEASGAPLWSPDPARLAELTYGSATEPSLVVGRNVKAGSSLRPL